MPFTARQINALKSKKGRYEVPEPGRTGLSVRVSPHGLKTWAFRYRFHGEQKRMVFGTYPTLGLADVRVKLADAQKLLREGRDPGALLADERHALRTAPTMGDLAQDYLTRHADKTMRPATVKEDRRILNKEILPAWRHRLARDIMRRDVMALLNGVEDRGVYVMRNRVAGVLSRVFLYALNQGMINGSPAVQLPRLRKIKNQRVEQPRARFLSEKEILSFWSNLDKIPVTPSIRASLKWLLITGQRRGETVLAQRSHIDDTARLWRIPPENAKTDREQLVPIPALALDVLAEADAARIRPQPTRLNRKDRTPHDPTPSPWLFPSTRHGRPITAAAVTCAVVRHRQALGIGDATVHDLRRSFATWHGELGTPPEILSALLGHAPNSITRQVYDQSLLLERRREAMEKWSAWLSRLLAGETPNNVIPLASAIQRAGQ